MSTVGLLICPASRRMGTLCSDDRCLSVRLSVCLSVCPVPLPGPKSRTEGCSKLKTAKRKVHDTSDPRPHLEVKRSKIKIITRLNAITQNQSYLRNFKLETRYTDEVQDRQRRYGRCPQRSNKITVITTSLV